ncbi:hypothetical protein CBL_00470 [Carabus blaptoides fortunei]
MDERSILCTAHLSTRTSVIVSYGYIGLYPLASPPPPSTRDSTGWTYERAGGEQTWKSHLPYPTPASQCYVMMMGGDRRDEMHRHRLEGHGGRTNNPAGYEASGRRRRVPARMEQEP